MKYGNGAEGERDWPQSKKTPTRLDWCKAARAAHQSPTK